MKKTYHTDEYIRQKVEDLFDATHEDTCSGQVTDDLQEIVEQIYQDGYHDGYQERQALGNFQ